MIHRILHLGEAPLRVVAKPVTVFDEALKTLVDDMTETMRKADGVGLAATQLGVDQRVVIIELEKNLFVMVNPEIVEASGKETCEEGCLSVPGIREQVTRATKVVAQAQDASGALFELEAEGLLARAIQHECDHLDGIVFVDRISKARKIQIKRELEMVKEGKIPNRGRNDDDDDDDSGDEEVA